jgi:hypothetical protein
VAVQQVIPDLFCSLLPPFVFGVPQGMEYHANEQILGAPTEQKFAEAVNDSDCDINFIPKSNI